MGEIEEALKESIKENKEQHSEIIQMIALLSRHVEDNAKFQYRLRWTVGIVSTIFGIILMVIYHHLPWIWNALPKHGHTH